MNKILILLAALSIQATAAAQTAGQAPRNDLSYSFAELRYVDVDTSGGDGFRIGGSYELDGPWIVVGALTALDFNNNVDATLFEIGGGYVWKYSDDFDLVSTVRLVRADVDTPGGDSDDNGFALSSGVRGFIAPKFEVRGSVNHINLDDNDTFLQLAGDYYFTNRVSAGLSLDFGGDSDNFTLGARWYFK